MEILAIPVVALGALYYVSSQQTECATEEPFTSLQQTNYLPNVNTPDRNFKDDSSLLDIGSVEDIDYTSKLSTANRYDGGEVYTDKYFNQTRHAQTAQDVMFGERIYDSLTGDKVDSTYFQHANMAPYFGSNVRTPFSDSNTSESVLDNMVGAGSQIQNKTEQSPLFSPSENFKWTHGAPNQTDFVRSRMNVSNKMSNVKPFEEERVAPGLNGENGNGFNSGMMARETWLPKTVDDLRISSNPKASHMLMGHEGPAISRITNIGLLGQQEKNRPERAYETGPERYMTTTGLEKGQMLHSIPVERDVNRTTTTTSYVGIAGSSNPETYVEGQYMPSKHIDLGAVPLYPANAVGRSGAREGEFGIKGKMAYPNNRTINRTDDYFGAVGGAFGSVISPLLDILRPSRRENTIGSLRPYQNPTAPVHNSYLFNPADRPAPTIREMTEQSIGHKNINAGQRGGGYAVAEQQQAYTTRSQTGDYYYGGIAGGGEGHKQVRPYDAEYAQRNNDIKSSTIEGRMVPGNMSLLNSEMNISSKPKDVFMRNDRPIAPTSMPYQSPDASNIGRQQGSVPLYQNAQLDRTNPEILNSLKSNPYTLSIVNGI